MMQDKRQKLSDWLQNSLSVHGNFNVVQELKRETFDSVDRATRIKIMGDPTAYCEILNRPRDTGVGQRTSGNTRRKGRYHNFYVRIWFQYPNQDEFDTLSEQTVLDGLEQLALLDDYKVMYPENIRILEVALDSTAKELAHYMEFEIEIR